MPASSQPSDTILHYDLTETGIVLNRDFMVSIAGEVVTIPAGTPSDGATIPKPLWPIIGRPLDAEYLPAAVVHDYFCDQANDRNSWQWRVVGDAYFAFLLRDLNVPLWKRSIMFYGVFLWGRIRFGTLLMLRKVLR